MLNLYFILIILVFFYVIFVLNVVYKKKIKLFRKLKVNYYCFLLIINKIKEIYNL